MNTTIDEKTAHRDIENTDDIKFLVDTFYDQALADPLIGFFFNDVAQIDLEEHLPKMYAFWSAMILGLPTYRRNAFLPHAELAEKHPMAAKHFARWLKLFYGTIDDNFDGPNAERAKQRAQYVATAMAGKLVTEASTLEPSIRPDSVSA